MHGWWHDQAANKCGACVPWRALLAHLIATAWKKTQQHTHTILGWASVSARLSGLGLGTVILSVVTRMEAVNYQRRRTATEIDERPQSCWLLVA